MWTVEDAVDGVPAEEKTVVCFDGHTDTVQALRPRWREAIGGGIDPYHGLVDAARSSTASSCERELGYLPPDEEWEHLVLGPRRGRPARRRRLPGRRVEDPPRARARGARSAASSSARYATVTEEDNDGGGPMYVMRHELPGAPR